jgi:hypothetical protein
MQMVDKADFGGKGRILAVHFDPVTGRHVPVNERFNIVTYQAADIMARLVGGSPDYAPKYMGFVYGPSGATPPPIPTDRLHTWDMVVGDISNIAGNILLVPLSNAVSYSVEGSAANYAGNALTFNSFANENIPFTLMGSEYEQVLLSAVVTPGSSVPAYRVFARVSLLDTGLGVPVDPVFELAVYWTIAFK